MISKIASLVLKFQNLIHEFSEKAYASQRNKLAREEWLFFGVKSMEDQLLDARKFFIKASKIITIIALFLLALFILRSIFGEPITDKLGREEYGGRTKKVDVAVGSTYLHSTVEQKFWLLVLPKTLSPSEEADRIEKCISGLAKDILGSNKGFMHITEDLNLILYDDKTGVSIEWESENPKYINTEGQINFLALTQREAVVLTANLTIGKSKRRHSFVFFLKPFSEVDYTKNLERETKDLVSRLNENVEGTQLNLPARGANGEILRWSSPQQVNPFFLILFCLFSLVLVYFFRYDWISKDAKRRKGAIEEEIPNLALQLILLLDAGLIVSAAFQEILFQNKDNRHPLYHILAKLSFQSSQSNESFVRAFYAFSQRSGNRNLIRFTTLVADHEIRGSELSVKLQKERDILWESRLQLAKARAKQAETKLCLPLMLLLLVLVIISVSPALLEL
ncbi:MAG: hypothetical protein EOM59_02780 [Clostridia bacterium]|nr:hypothetical protein [Clostridia bacterium]